MQPYIGGKAIDLDAAAFIQSGGEADVFRYGRQAIKIFKPANHPDLKGQPTEQAAARARLAEHQLKLRAFPGGLPDEVIAPMELVTDSAGQKIIGYSMRLISPSQTLMRYGDRGWRQTGVDPTDVTTIFSGLHRTVEAVHQAGAVIGDFNDLNVLVKEKRAYLIDTDSWQFDRYRCSVFTARFTDPKLFDNDLRLAKVFDTDSDWYAYAVMLMQSLLYVEPYGGIYKQGAGSRLPVAQRPLKRITVFHPDVRYPKPAIPLDRLPDDLLDRFQRVFVQDERGTFPLKLVEALRWTKCRNCGTEHARSVCPVCVLAPKAAIKAVVTHRGNVKATKLFATTGTILAASVSNGQLLWLYNQNSQFRREGNVLVLTGSVEPSMRYRIAGKSTILAKADRAVIVKPGQSSQSLAVDNYGNLPQIDANGQYRYWISQGQLCRTGQWDTAVIGQVLKGQTHFWIGPKFGFGFYRFGQTNQGFVFEAEAIGLNDTLKLPPMTGHLTAATAIFTDQLCWFFWTNSDAGGLQNHAAIINRSGQIEATAETASGDGSWLGQIYGKAASGNFVLAATDDGIVRAEIAGGKIVQTRSFPDTEPYVDSASQLFIGEDGLYAVTRKDIILLKIA